MKMIVFEIVSGIFACIGAFMVAAFIVYKLEYEPIEKQKQREADAKLDRIVKFVEAINADTKILRFGEPSYNKTKQELSNDTSD